MTNTLVFFYSYGMGGWGDMVKGLHTCWCWAKATHRELKIDFSWHIFGTFFKQHRYLQDRPSYVTLNMIDKSADYTVRSLDQYADKEEIVLTCNWFKLSANSSIDPLPFYKELYTTIFPLTIEKEIPATYHTFHCRVGDKYLQEAYGSKGDNRIGSFDRLGKIIDQYNAFGHSATLVASDSEAVVNRLLKEIPGSFTLCPKPYHIAYKCPDIEFKIPSMRNTILEHYAMTKSQGIYKVSYSGFPITAALIQNVPLQVWSMEGSLGTYRDEMVDAIRECYAAASK
uniref:Glycosyltransferase n=1 Tax=viral metagenome TaxID=1070528 RepID=A0A6C0K271_9ZZZZ